MPEPRPGGAAENSQGSAQRHPWMAHKPLSAPWRGAGLPWQAAGKALPQRPLGQDRRVISQKEVSKEAQRRALKRACGATLLSLVRVLRGSPRTDSVDEQFEDRRAGASLAGGALIPGSSRLAGGWIDVQPVRGHRRP